MPSMFLSSTGHQLVSNISPAVASTALAQTSVIPKIIAVILTTTIITGGVVGTAIVIRGKVQPEIVKDDKGTNFSPQPLTTTAFPPVNASQAVKENHTIMPSYPGISWFLP